MSQSRPPIAPLPPAPAVGQRPIEDGPGEPTPGPLTLSLTDFLDLTTLQEVQDSFTAVTRLRTTICDPQGRPITTQTDAAQRNQSDKMLEQLISPDAKESGRFTAPIVVEGQPLGSIVIEPQAAGTGSGEGLAQLRELARGLGIADEHVDRLIQKAEESCGPNHAAAVQFLYLLANSIARLCYDEYHARRRAEELAVLYRISTVLSAHRDLQQVLDTAVRSVADLMRVKAVGIRLLEPDAAQQRLVPRASHNLSQTYLDKGAIVATANELFCEALAGKVVYVERMADDSRVVYPGDAVREGLVSMLCAGIIFQGRPIGTLQLFTGQTRAFADFEVNLVQAIAQLLAAAIENTRLDIQRAESQQMMRQLHLAADVQRRMLPRAMPHVPPYDIAARYVPSLELGGDFYDFVYLDGHLGIVVGDVVGKGVAASLLMASVRASLRAFAQDLYDLDEVIARVNTALCRDTLDKEFATIWYGVLDPAVMRLTYCNAGHEPPLLVRRGKIRTLGIGGMVVGIDPAQEYDKGLCDLEPGDMLLLYTDGLPDAFNFDWQRFGRARIEAALLEAADRSGSAHDALNHVLWAMRRHTGLHRSIDDTTLVVIKVGQ